jgi:hypothetical protein
MCIVNNINYLSRCFGFSNKVLGNRVTINPENLNGAALYG